MHGQHVWPSPVEKTTIEQSLKAKAVYVEQEGQVEGGESEPNQKNHRRCA